MGLGIRRLFSCRGAMIASASTLSLVASGAAMAQQAPTSSASTADEEIVVTAQRRSERLFDVPQSVTAVTGDALEQSGATQLRDFANSVPGLSFTTFGAGDTKISIRGVSTGFIEISPTVAIYVDEVPYGASTSFAQGARYTPDSALVDLDRIEVLRGPQGTLYGASAIGGLVKYVNNAPNLTEFSGRARLGAYATEHGDPGYNGSLTINLPLMTDRAAVRATGFYVRDSGFINNVVSGRDVGGSRSYGGRIDLSFAPSDRLSIRLSGFIQSLSRLGDATADYSFAGEPLFGELSQNRVRPEPLDRDFRLVSGVLDYDLGFARLRSITGYQEIKTRIGYDYSAQYVPLLQNFFGRTYSAVGLAEVTSTKKFTQEVRLQSDHAGPIEWVVGGFYNHERGRAAQQFELFNAAGAPVTNDLLAFRLPSSFEEMAVFANLTWNLTERFDVSGGLRYAHNDQAFEQIGSGLLIGSKPFTTSEEDVVTYLANARYRFSDRAMVYLRYATGYRPGGPNYAPINPATGQPVGPPSFDADRLTSYEIGFRAETPDRIFRGEVSAYHIDWADFQTSAVFAGLFSAIVNATGGAEIDGLEASASVRPTPGLTLSSTFAYQDARLAAADANLRAAKGERLPGIPEISATLSAEYAYNAISARPHFGATVRYMSDRKAGYNAGTGSRTQYTLPDYAIVDLQGGFSLGSVDVNLFVHNLFDSRAQLSAYTSIARPHVALAQPRTIGVGVAFPF